MTAVRPPYGEPDLAALKDWTEVFPKSPRSGTIASRVHDIEPDTWGELSPRQQVAVAKAVQIAVHASGQAHDARGEPIPIATDRVQLRSDVAPVSVPAPAHLSQSPRLSEWQAEAAKRHPPHLPEYAILATRLPQPQHVSREMLTEAAFAIPRVRPQESQDARTPYRRTALAQAAAEDAAARDAFDARARQDKAQARRADANAGWVAAAAAASDPMRPLIPAGVGAPPAARVPAAPRPAPAPAAAGDHPPVRPPSPVVQGSRPLLKEAATVRKPAPALAPAAGGTVRQGHCGGGRPRQRTKKTHR